MITCKALDLEFILRLFEESRMTKTFSSILSRTPSYFIAYSHRVKNVLSYRPTQINFNTFCFYQCFSNNFFFKSLDKMIRRQCQTRTRHIYNISYINVITLIQEGIPLGRCQYNFKRVRRTKKGRGWLVLKTN